MPMHRRNRTNINMPINFFNNNPDVEYRRFDKINTNYWRSSLTKKYYCPELRTQKY